MIIQHMTTIHVADTQLEYVGAVRGEATIRLRPPMVEVDGLLHGYSFTGEPSALKEFAAGLMTAALDAEAIESDTPAVMP